jgi:hypothetical protein
VTYPAYIRDKARAMRTERNLSIDEIAERLALPRTTVFYWLRDLPIDRSARPRTQAQINGNLAMQEKYRRLREAAYAEGRASFDALALDPSFRDFRFWGAQLGIRPEEVRMQRKSNSNQLTGRTWRSVHGVLTVRVCDTLLRARLEGWMDRLRESWL